MSDGFKNELWSGTVYFAHAGTGKGASALDPLPMVTVADALNLPDGVVVYDASVVITTIVTGTTAIDVGDATDPNGYVATVDITLGTVGAYDGQGAYVASNAEKFNAAAIDSSVTFTTTSTAGALAVHYKGYRV